MNAVQQRDDNSGLGETDSQDGGLEFESDDGFLFGIVPDYQLWKRILISVYSLLKVI